MSKYTEEEFAQAVAVDAVKFINALEYKGIENGTVTFTIPQTTADVYLTKAMEFVKAASQS